MTNGRRLPVGFDAVRRVPIAATGAAARSTRRRVLACCLAALLLTGPAGAAEPAAAQPAAALAITGDVQRPQTLDVPALRAFASATLSSFRTSREIDGTKQETVLRGVRLRAVLEQAGLAERDHYDWRKTVVVASATDGYRVVFSWPELFNTEGGAQTLVVYERDGAPLDAREGPIAIAVPGDVRSGPRHVKWLNRIEVRVLRD